MIERIQTQMLHIRSMAPHYHEDSLELILVLKGSLTIYRMERQMVLREGQFTFVNRRIVHHILSEGADVLSTRICLKEFRHIFERIEFVEFMNAVEDPKIPKSLKNRFDMVITDFLIRDYQLKNRPELKAEKEFNENQLVHFLFTMYQMANCLSKDEAYVSAELLDRFYMIVEYISTHIREKITVEDILKLVYMNPTYFSQFMKRVGGVPFKEFLSYRKLMVIETLLLDDSYSMSEIAAAVDLTDMKAFYHMFKKYFRTSPAKWREHLKQIHDDYTVCEERVLLDEFVIKYRIYKHKENSLARIYRYLTECQRQGISLRGIDVCMSPYEDMTELEDEDYQPYKYSGSLFHLIHRVGANVVLTYSMDVMRIPHHRELLIDTLQKFATSYGIGDLKKWRIILFAKNGEDMDAARQLQGEIFREVGMTDVRPTLDLN